MSDREIHITVEVNSKPTLINKDELNEIYKYIDELISIMIEERKEEYQREKGDF